ncbi:MAG: hypothetical protein ACKOA9_12440 [Actinomycetota bacterium]
MRGQPTSRGSEDAVVGERLARSAPTGALGRMGTDLTTSRFP